VGYVKVAEKSEITVGEKKKVLVEGKEVLLVNINNSYYAISSKCPHMGGDLSQGKLEGASIVCPKHGARFNVITGKVEQGAKILFIKMKVKDVTKYSVKIKGNVILVDVS